MRVLSPHRLYDMTDGQFRGFLKVVAAMVPEGTVYALEKGQVAELVNEPYDSETARGYEADGFTVHHS